MKSKRKGQKSNAKLFCRAALLWGGPASKRHSSNCHFMQNSVASQLYATAELLKQIMIKTNYLILNTKQPALITKTNHKQTKYFNKTYKIKIK